MINSARTELARDPAIWWNLLAGFAFMVVMVLSLQLFASGVQDAFDPRAHAMRVQRKARAAVPGAKVAA
jgi:peptide/nickel transport system permease protein